MQKSGGFTADCKGNTPNAIFGVVIAQRGYAEHPATDYPKADGAGHPGEAEERLRGRAPWPLEVDSAQRGSVRHTLGYLKAVGMAPFGLLPTLGVAQLVQDGFFLCCTSVRCFVRLRTEGERPSV